MIPYYILIVIPTILSVVKNKSKLSNIKNISIIFFFAILLLLLFLRSIDIGNDLMNYKRMFMNVEKIEWNEISAFENIEPCFVLLEKMIYSIVPNYRLFLCVCALLSVVPLAILYSKETNYPVLTISLFVGSCVPFSMFFSGLRQSIAMGFGIIAYYFTKNKKLFPFLITVLVAYLFHQSGIILIFMYPLYKLQITRKNIPIVIIIIAVSFIFNKQIFSFLIKTIARYEDRYSTLTTTNAYGSLILLIIFAIFAFLIPDEKHISLETRGLRNFLLFSIIIQCFAPIHNLAMRMNYYYLLFIPILLPKIIDESSKRMCKIASISKYAMSAFFIFRFFYEAYFGADILQIFPYHFFWEV